MHPQIEALFDEAESRYLKPEELAVLSQYVDSLPARLTTYRALRDRELDVMQQVADQLQLELPQEKIEHLERALKDALLTLRYCAMGMLLNDEKFVKERLMSWLSGTMSLYNSQTINTVLYRLLHQRLTEVLGTQAMSFLTPPLMMAQTLFHEKNSYPAMK
uniref:Phycobilisome protein n=1 Tax=Oscillatoriales cyanobacterium SpSt-402 TaxID=2282168 RepID=A0A832M103_9CYAN